MELRGKEKYVHVSRTKSSIMAPWAGFTNDGSFPFLILLSPPLFLFFVFLLILPIPLYLPSFSPSFLLVYPTNHVLVLKGYSTDISHMKYLIFIPAQPDLISCLFLKTKLQHVKGKLRTLALPYHELQPSSRRKNNWSPGSFFGGLCWSTLLIFQN